MVRKNKSKKTKDWFNKQSKDVYIKQARSQGLRARSSFKLQDIDMRNHLIQPGVNIVDLGSSPGSWSEYVVKKQKEKGRLVSVDLLSMSPIDGAIFIQGDFTLSNIQEEILQNFNQSSIALVLSDMAPNLTGIAVRDQANVERIQNNILQFCQVALNINGMVLTKIFDGEQLGSIKKSYENYFKKIQIIKPHASRSASREVFLLAQNFKSEHKLDQIPL